MSGEETSAEVIHKIQARDTKYRVFFVILMIVVIVSLFGVIFLQAQALSEFRGQSAERAASLKALQQQNLEASGRTNSYLQCLARFFAEQDRTNLTLTDLDKCSYERGGNAVPGVDVTPTGGPADQQTTAPSGTSQQMPTVTPPAGQTPSTPAQNTPKPVEVLGIPVCIPLTNVCIVR